MSSIDTFVYQENTDSGRGLDGVSVEYNATGGAAAGANLGNIAPPAGTNAVIGFQSAHFMGGSTGYDVVLLDGPRTSYEIAVNASGTTTITDIGAGDATLGQMVTVTGESAIIFNGAHIALSDPATPAALTTPPGGTTPVLNYPNDIVFVVSPADAQLAQFYSATLPWEPQPALGGFEYWEARLAAGMSLESIAQSFINTSYFQQTFGDPSLTGGGPAAHVQHLAYVELLYSHILGMNVDATNGGVQYWTNDMDTGVLNAATTLISFTNATSTASLINATAGSTAGTGTGWLINYEVTGGYADPGVQESAALVLAAADTSGTINTSLISLSGLATTGTVTDTPSGDAVAPGVSGSAGSVEVVTANETVVLSPSFTSATIFGSGVNVVGSPAGEITVQVEAPNVNVFLHGTNNTILAGPHLQDPTVMNVTIVGYTPGGDALYIQSGLGVSTVILAPTATSPVLGSTLNFTAHNTYIDVGTLADSSAGTMATAANAVYVVADHNGTVGNAADDVGESIVFFGQVGTSTVAYTWGQPLPNPLSGATTAPGADTLNTHMVSASEFTGSVTLIGVTATALTATDFK